MTEEAKPKKKNASKKTVKAKKVSKQKPSQNISKLPAVAKQQVFKITDEKKESLKKYEDVISSKLDSFLDVVVALRHIQVEKLWKCHVDDKGEQLYNTFEEYTLQKFDFKRAYYSKLNAAARAYESLEEVNPELVKELPRRCNVYYQLSRVKDGEKMVKIINKIMEEDGAKIEGAAIERLVEMEIPKRGRAINKANRQMSSLLGLLANLDENDAEGAFDNYLADTQKKREDQNEDFDRDAEIAQVKEKLTALLKLIQ